MSFFSPAPPVTYRPLSVSIIGWYYAVSGAFGLLMFWVPLVFPHLGMIPRASGNSLPVYLGLGAVISATQVVSGTAILKRQRWGRVLLLASLPAALLVLAFLSPFMFRFAAAGSALTFGILAFFLTRPAASGYFDGSILSMPEDIRRVRRFQRGERTQSDVARVFGIIFAFPGWWILATATAILVGVVVSSGRASESFFRTGFSTFVFSAQGVGVAILGVGTLLWGRRRWRGYLGWGLLVLGANAAIFGLLAFFPFDPTQFIPPDQQGTLDPEQFMATFRKAGQVAAIVGAVLLPLGGLMVSAQRRHDHAAAAFMDAETPPSD